MIEQCLWFGANNTMPSEVNSKALIHTIHLRSDLQHLTLTLENYAYAKYTAKDKSTQHLDSRYTAQKIHFISQTFLT